MIDAMTGPVNSDDVGAQALFTKFGNNVYQHGIFVGGQVGEKNLFAHFFIGSFGHPGRPDFFERDHVVFHYACRFRNRQPKLRRICRAIERAWVRNGQFGEPIKKVAHRLIDSARIVQGNPLIGAAQLCGRQNDVSEESMAWRKK